MTPTQREAAKKNSRDHYKNNPEYYKNWRRQNVASRLCSVAKQRATLKGIEFNITKEDIVLPTHCPILGLELEVHIDGGAGGKDNSYSLDRIDPTKGYVKGNIQVISNKANSMKFTASPEELLQFAKWIQETYGN